MMRRAFSLKRSANQGFTLIEILVTLSLTGVMIGIIMTGYRNYNQRQTVVAAAKRIRQVFQEAKANAAAGRIDCNVCGGGDHTCDGRNDDAFIGWRMRVSCNTFGGGNGSYTIQGACGGWGGSTFMPRTETFPANVYVTVDSYDFWDWDWLWCLLGLNNVVQFNSGDGGTNLSGNMNVLLRWKDDATTQQTVVIAPSGLVQ